MARDRVICCGGATNLRDMGGYVTTDGQHRTRWNRLFRSDTLSRIEVCESNMSHLKDKLNIDYAIDFRAPSERTADPYLLPHIPTFSIPVEPGNVMRIFQDTPELNEAVAVECMKVLYKSLVDDFTSAFSRFFRLLIDNVPKGKAMIFHCTAGKDRTGYAAMLLLSALDVPVDTIMEDYLMTNQYYRPPPFETLRAGLPGKQITDEGIRAIYSVRREYLQSAIDTILSRHKNITEYIVDELGVTEDDLRTLRAALLVPVDSTEDCGCDESAK